MADSILAEILVQVCRGIWWVLRERYFWVGDWFRGHGGRGARQLKQPELPEARVHKEPGGKRRALAPSAHGEPGSEPRTLARPARVAPGSEPRAEPERQPELSPEQREQQRQQRLREVQARERLRRG